MKKALIVTNLEIIFSVRNHSMIDPLSDLGYEITYASNFSEYKGDITQIKCKTIHIDFSRNPYSPQNIRAYRQMLQLMKEQKFDLVHCNNAISGMIGRLCARKLGIYPVIYTVHGFMFYRNAPFINWLLYYPAELLLARLTDVLITINKEDYEHAINFKLRQGGKTYYVPGVGVNTGLIESANSKRPEVLSQLSIPDSAFLLIAVGELNKNKNHEAMITALGALKNPNVHLILCGVGDLQAKLINLAREYNIAGNIHFLGYRTDVPQLLKSSDCFVMTSYREGLPQAIMEAMSAGLPCIVSKIRGHIDLIEDDKGGYLYSPDDVTGFAGAIGKLANDPVLRSQMGKYNQAFVQKYDLENVKKEMSDIYKNVSGSI